MKNEITHNEDEFLKIPKKYFLGRVFEFHTKKITMDMFGNNIPPFILTGIIEVIHLSKQNDFIGLEIKLTDSNLTREDGMNYGKLQINNRAIYKDVLYGFFHTYNKYFNKKFLITKLNDFDLINHPFNLKQ